MIWMVLECVLALALFVFIVWWTLPRKREQDGSQEPDSPQRHRDTEKNKSQPD